jgi:hypothetical protein
MASDASKSQDRLSQVPVKMKLKTNVSTSKLSISEEEKWFGSPGVSLIKQDTLH